MKDEKCKWVTGKQESNYTYRDLMANALLIYNNEVENKTWEFTEAIVPKAVGKCGTNAEDNFITLLANQLDNL